jgi:hypothetical protein
MISVEFENHVICRDRRWSLAIMITDAVERLRRLGDDDDEIADFVFDLVDAQPHLLVDDVVIDSGRVIVQLADPETTSDDADRHLAAARFAATASESLSVAEVADALIENGLVSQRDEAVRFARLHAIG